MAIPKYQSNLLSDYWVSQRQRRATGARPDTTGERRGTMDALLSRDFQRGEAAAERGRLQGNWEQQFAQQQKLYDDQARAAKVSGVTDLLGLGLSYKLGSQYADMYKGLLGGSVGGAANVGGVSGSANIVGGGSLLGGQAISSQGTPVLATEAFGGGALAPAQAALPGAGAVGLAAGGGLLGSSLLQKAGINKDISESLSYTAAGAALGSVFPGVGTAVGGAIGFGVSLIDDVFGGLF
jgi:hypothetical protein